MILSPLILTFSLKGRRILKWIYLYFLPLPLGERVRVRGI
jgi:hypothetical protein